MTQDHDRAADAARLRGRADARIDTLAPLSTFFRRERRSFAATYGLTLLERACVTALPVALGWAVDGLLAGRHGPLVLFASLWGAQTVVGALRRRLDTRVFTRMYARVALAAAFGHGTGGPPALGIASARLELVRDLVAFFEVEVPATMHNAIAILGSIAVLAMLDVRVAAIVVVALLPVVALDLQLWRCARRAHSRINDGIEGELEVLELGDEPRLRRHLAEARRWRIALSDAEARAWGGTELCALGAAMLVLLLCVESSSPAGIGMVFAMLKYLYDLFDAANDLPNVIGGLAKLTDVRRRLLAS